jgi:hypothetical protein
MYFLSRIKPELSAEEEGRRPNAKSKRMYKAISQGTTL